LPCSTKKRIGYSDEELQRTTFYEHIRPDDYALVAAAANEARPSGIGRGVEYRIRRKDDSWMVVESTARLFQNQGSAG
jgi:PAS domain-containing protein